MVQASDIYNMAWCKRDVTPMLLQWSYIFFVWSHQNERCVMWASVAGLVVSGDPGVGWLQPCRLLLEPALESIDWSHYLVPQSRQGDAMHHGNTDTRGWENWGNAC